MKGIISLHDFYCKQLPGFGERTNAACLLSLQATSHSFALERREAGKPSQQFMVWVVGGVFFLALIVLEHVRSRACTEEKLVHSDRDGFFLFFS